MNKFQKLIGRLTLGLTESQLEKLSEAVVVVDGYENGWRKISGRRYKGLDLLTRDKQLDIAFTLYLRNVIAKAIIDTINNFVFGEGFSFDVTDKTSKLPQYKVDNPKKILQEFWDNNFADDRLERKGVDISVSGMLCLPVFENSVNGEIELGFIDPKNIKDVDVNPLNVEDIMQINLKQISTLGATERKLKVIRKVKGKENLNEEDYGLLSGECFFFAINNVSNQPEGVSDLLNCADMISDFEDLLKALLEHAKASHIYFQKVKLKTMNDTQIKEWADKNPIPEPGSRILENENVDTEILTPDIKGVEQSALVRLFKNLILMSKSLPEHWFSDGGNSNLATAVEQGTAIYKLIKKRQMFWVGAIKKILTFVLHRAAVAGKIEKTDLEKLEIKIITPEFVTRDLSNSSNALKNISEFINSAVAGGYITKETAGKIYRSLAEQFGYPIDEISEMERLQEEEKKNAA